MVRGGRMSSSWDNHDAAFLAPVFVETRLLWNLYVYHAKYSSGRRTDRTNTPRTGLSQPVLGPVGWAKCMDYHLTFRVHPSPEATGWRR